MSSFISAKYTIVAASLLLLLAGSCKQRTVENHVIQTKNDSISFAQTLSCYANIYDNKRCYDTAVALYSMAIKFNPESHYYDNRAFILAITGRYHLAIRDFKYVIDKETGDNDSQRKSFIAVCYFKLNEIDSSTKYINLAIAEATMREPNNYYDSGVRECVYQKQALLLEQQGLLKESITAYKKAIEYGLHDCSDYFFIAELYQELNEPQNQRNYYILAKNNGCKDADDSLRKYKLE